MAFGKAREKIAAVFALLCIVLFVAVGAAIAGLEIPILKDITDAIGIGQE